jgi:hypothetical protein
MRRFLVGAERARSTSTGLLLVALSAAVFSQSPALVYQDRGGYREGVRSSPSVNVSVDLIAAQVDMSDNRPPGPLFRASFFLPERSDLTLTIREIDQRYSYWLDGLRPRADWKAGAVNQFEWPTAPVIQALTWMPPRLTLGDLGGTVRVGTGFPSMVERVLPVVLSQGAATAPGTAYLFAFRVTARARLRFETYGAGDLRPRDVQTFPRVDPLNAQRVTIAAASWPEGWYRIVISGYGLSDNAEVNQVINFYHSRNLLRPGG